MNIFNLRGRGRDRDANDDADLGDGIEEGGHEQGDEAEGERTVSSVNRGMRISTKVTHLLIWGAIILVVIAVFYQTYVGAAKKKQEAAAALSNTGTTTMQTLLPPLTPVAAETPPPPPPLPPQLAPIAQPVAGPPPAHVPTDAEIRLARQMKPGLSFNKTGNKEISSTVSGSVVGNSPGMVTGGNAGDDPLAKQNQVTKFSGARAYMLPDPSMMITQGAAIPCTVIAAIDTTLPGIVTCIQSADVWSTDHKIMLLEKGTKWVGQQRGGMQQGQRRVGIVWSRGETPNHVLVDVESAGGDELGRAGIAGFIDNHFWERFGAAIMVSLISDVGSYAAASQQSSGGNTIVFPNTVQGAQSAMSEILKSTVNIPPTLTRNQGAEIVIYVVRDLDFRGVYDLKLKDSVAADIVVQKPTGAKL